MLNIAAAATNGVTIPSRKVCRDSIIRVFNTQMDALKRTLNVCTYWISYWFSANNQTQSDAVTGEINLTCDAWQADNVNGYFAVTAHWIEEIAPASWELRSALIGFTQLNNAHNGERLGQALYKITDRLGIAGRVRTFSIELQTLHCWYSDLFADLQSDLR